MSEKKSYEELKEELQNLLDNGQIDLRFYEAEVQKLNRKIRMRDAREEANKKEKVNNKISVIATVVILFVAAIILIFQLSGKGFFWSNKYEAINSFDSIPVPTQKRLKMEEIEFLEILGKEYKVKLIYEYTVYGKVVGTLDYSDKTEHGMVVPKDVGLEFGPLAQDRFLKHLQLDSKYIKSMGRVLFHKVKSAEGERILTNMGYGSYIANNHILGATEEVRKDIDKIKIGDYIKLKGYLCEVVGSYEKQLSSGRGEEVEYTIMDSDYEGRSNNDCETIYVTEVKWLREK